MNRRRSSENPLTLFSFQDIITSVTGVIMLLTLLLAVDLTTRRADSAHANAREVASELQQAITEAQIRLDELRSMVATRASDNRDVGTYTQLSANREIKAVAEEISLLQNKIDQLRNKQRQLSDDKSAADTKWNNRVTDVNQLEDLKETRLALEAEVTDLKNSQRVFYNNADSRGRQVVLVELFESDILAAEAGKKETPLRFSGKLSQQSFLNWASDQSASRCRFVFIVHSGTTHEFQELSQQLRDKGFSIGFDLLPDDKNAIDLKQGAG